ncbi:YxeA family protein [Staphylococcus caeli]|uniref:YxeA family protein n=1 Tax=Staphylococcus caeli TaxID=2201815 RepID=UPI003F57E9A0
MKKVFLLLTGFCFIILLSLIALSVLAFSKSNSESEISQIIDQYNPLVKKQHSYLITKQNPDQLLEHGRVSYTQNAVDEQGNVTQLTFTAIEKLKPNRYLKVTHKKDYVKTYEEVNEKEVPTKALKELYKMK